MVIANRFWSQMFRFAFLIFPEDVLTCGNAFYLWAGWSIDLTSLTQTWSYEAVAFGHMIISGLLLAAHHTSAGVFGIIADVYQFALLVSLIVVSCVSIFAGGSSTSPIELFGTDTNGILVIIFLHDL